MVIQTEVKLQAGYVLSACDGGEIPHFQKLLFDQLASVPVFDDFKY